MHVKKFQGESMQEALVKVKQIMGPDAVILHTKTFKRGGFLGFGGREIVEVTASDDIKISDDTASLSARARKAYADVQRSANGMRRRRAKVVEAQEPSLGAQIKELKALIEFLSGEAAAGGGFPRGLATQYQRLVDSGVTKPLARRIVRAIHDELDGQSLVDEKVVRERLDMEIARYVRITGGITPPRKSRARVVALVGPTGVGKTTSTAKLSANLSMKEGKRVALVTADTYRIAATDQLKVYADIIGVPLEVALSPKDMKAAVKRYKDCDYIFIDTAGGSQYNEEQLAELKRYLDAASTDETHLVLSATTDFKELLRVIEKFSVVKPDCLLFSKIDETQQRGVILNTVSQVNKPISFFSTGQNVPDDIRLARVDSITRMMLGDGNP
jgi:flagellar biosynthesis protein FlhF